jgi:hypothetical protein
MVYPLYPIATVEADVATYRYQDVVESVMERGSNGKIQ